MIERVEEDRDRDAFVPGARFYRITYNCGCEITAMRYREPKVGTPEACPKSHAASLDSRKVG